MLDFLKFTAKWPIFVKIGKYQGPRTLTLAQSALKTQIYFECLLLT